jgi:3D (Asp-Asp-Asp) domain-containing protein
MNRLRKICCLWLVFITFAAPGVRYGPVAASGFDFPDQAAQPEVRPSVIITDVYATGYFCVYNSQLAGFQTITKTISNNIFTLKASFLFGGWGVAMQGTGRTDAGGDYIKYTGGGACFVRVAGPNAGRNIEGQWVVNPDVLRDRYAQLGITDFTGFGNLALLNPDHATYSQLPLINGSMGQPLTPWQSIAVDPSLIPLGRTITLLFKNDAADFDMSKATFRADDTGGSIKGKHIDIYLGEGQSAWDNWLRSGGNRYVDIYFLPTPESCTD